MAPNSVYRHIPCVATASHVLYCHGKEIYVQPHDTDGQPRAFEAHSEVRGICIDEFDDAPGTPTQTALSWGVDEIAELWHVDKGRIGRIGVYSAPEKISAACFISGKRIAICTSGSIFAL